MYAEARALHGGPTAPSLAPLARALPRGVEEAEDGDIRQRCARRGGGGGEGRRRQHNGIYEISVSIGGHQINRGGASSLGSDGAARGTHKGTSALSGAFMRLAVRSSILWCR